jgi:hypothetical protein
MARRKYPWSVTILGALVLLLFGAMAVSKTTLTAAHPEISATWIQVLKAPPQQQGEPKQTASNEEAFARQLEALTSFYGTIISVLIGILALVGAMAFFTIRLVTKNAAEEMALEAAGKIIRDSRDFERTMNSAIAAAVDKKVEARLEEMDLAMEEIGQQLEGLTSVVSRSDQSEMMTAHASVSGAPLVVASAVHEAEAQPAEARPADEPNASLQQGTEETAEPDREDNHTEPQAPPPKK